MHALIIEDEYFIAMLIEDCLRMLGFTSFAYATTEAEAVAAAKQRCPDLITADVRIAAGCGIDAVHTICDEMPVPVVYITASASTVKERCERPVVVQKPFGLTVLSEGVEQARSAARL